jgi:lysine-N-methylase
MRLHQLPVLQNWDCHGCGGCCYQYQAPVTEEERRRIEEQGWDKDPDLAGKRLFTARGPWWRRRYLLAHRPKGGGCVFLSAEGRCRIHERFGAEAKPLACRLFPFVLVPAGDHWRAGLRFACPSAASNRGRPLADHRADVEQFARLLERQEGPEVTTLPPPPLQPGQRVAWSDLLRFMQAILTLLQERDISLERRWRKCLALAALCRQAQFDKLTGGRLSEFLDMVSSGLDAEVPAEPENVPPPTWIGRMLFRQAAAVYSRKDWGPVRGPATRGVLGRLGIGIHFALGRGKMPRVNAHVCPGMTFAQMESPAGPLPPDAQAVLERYYQIKVESLQFCGPTGFGLSFWDGLESLALTLPLLLWLARGMEASSRAEAVERAVSIVDDHFGYNRALRSRRHHFIRRLLAGRGELARLMAWYSR